MFELTLLLSVLLLQLESIFSISLTTFSGKIGGFKVGESKLGVSRRL
jgi:hypothetical protein